MQGIVMGFVRQAIQARRLRPLSRDLLRPVLLILLPVLLLTAHMIGGIQALVLAGLALPLGLALAPRPVVDPRDPLTGRPVRAALVAQLDRHLQAGPPGTLCAVALVAEIDHFRQIEDRHGPAAGARVLQETSLRLTHVLRDSDFAVRLDGPSLGIAFGPMTRLDLDAIMYIAGRVQRALSEPWRNGHQGIHLSTSVGFALSNRLTDPTGDSLLQAATLALHEAQRSGTGAIRSYSDAMRARVAIRNNLADEVAGALDRGEILPFFQPQIDAATGTVSGFEALARWLHPGRGMIPPAEFLPAIEQAGLHDRLGARMLSSSLTALRGWQDAGLVVPRIGVNFSGPELSDPQLINRINWELDRFDLTPERLVIEVLETVVAARSEDAVIRNLAGLARLGCRLDLDDFGTGNASITSIRRFAIERIKIDRSFVTRIDEDPEQQKMVSAILTMAERLGLDTLAEGVETMAERQLLTDMGCGHLQGFCIARPMALDDATTWLRTTQSGDAGQALLRLPRRA
jgi:diguanylate cyclase (GGDEF)-like protein